MKEKRLAIEKMLPRIISTTIFEYEKAMPKKRERITNLYELGFYLDGDGTIFVGDNKYPVHFGDIRFSKPGMRVNSTPKYKCYTVVFDFGENNTIYKNQVLDNIPEYFSTNGELKHIFEKIIASDRSGDVSEKLNCNALLMHLIFELFQSFYSKKKYSEPVKMCIEYLDGNYKDKVTLAELGEKLNYSHIHIMRIFKKETGQTPHEWLTKIRINHAKELFNLTDKTMVEIADECGFSSDSHFKILFKKITGFTPGKYRKHTNQEF